MGQVSLSMFIAPIAGSVLMIKGADSMTPQFKAALICIVLAVGIGAMIGGMV